MKKILVLICCLQTIAAFSQEKDSTHKISFSDTLMENSIPLDTGYLPIIPPGPTSNVPLPNKRRHHLMGPQSQPVTVNLEENTVSTMSFSAPPEITHAHIPTSVVVSTSKDVGEIGINSQTSMGSMNYNIPLEVREGRNGLTPSISISYSSGGANGVLGQAWGIGGLSAITSANFVKHYDGYTNAANTNKLHPFTLDGMRLLEVEKNSSVITYEPEQGNLRIKGYLYGFVIRYFTVEYPNGNKAVYGYEDNWSGQIFYPLTQMTDALGNYLDVVYTYSNNHYYISRINYGGVKNKEPHYAYLDFTYKQREDVENAWLMGREIIEDRLLEHVKAYADGHLLRTYQFTYATDKVSLLAQVDCTTENGGSLNPLKFYYGYDNNRTEALSKTESQLVEYFTSGNLDLRKGKFDAGTDDDGLMVFPKVELGIDGQNGGIFQREKKWYFSKIAAGQQLLVYQGLQDDFNMAAKITAETNFMELTSGDLDGKFGEEVIKINNNDYMGWDKVSFKVYQPNIYTGLALKYERSFDLTSSVNFRDHNTSLWPKQYFTGDFTGIGRDMVFAVSIKNPLGMTYNSRCFLIDLEQNQVLFNAHVFNYDPSTDRIVPLDFNGDGKLDILHIKTDGTDVYSFNNYNQLVKLKGTTNFKRSSYSGREMAFGDINGDGKVDILISPYQSYYYQQTVDVPVSKPHYCNYCGADASQITAGYSNDYYCTSCSQYLLPSDYCYECYSMLSYNCDYSGNYYEKCCPTHGTTVTVTEYLYQDHGNTWQAYYSTGEDLVAKSLPIVNNSTGEKFHLEDVNQDGKSDLVRINGGSIYVYLNENGYFDESNYRYEYTTYNAMIVPSNVAHPEYHSFLMGIGVNQSGKLYKIRFSKNESKQRLLTGVQNSRGVIQRNYYQRMNEGASWGSSYGNVYTQGYGASAPFKNFTGPVWLTARQETYLDDNLIGNTAFNYHNAIIQLEGLGFRGFEKITTYDVIKGYSSEQTFDPVGTYGAMIKEVTPVSETTIQYDFYVASNKKVTLRPNYTIALDKLKNITAYKYISYDNYNNPVGESISFSGSGISQSTNRTYQNTVNADTYQIGLPLSASTTAWNNGTSHITGDEIIYYTGTLLPQRKFSKINNHTVKQVQWTYDSWGNVLTEQTEAFASGTFLEVKYEYESTGRYVTKMTDPLGRYKLFGAYNQYGKPATVTDDKGNVTTTVYDDWGRAAQVNNHDGTEDKTSVAWASGGPAGALVVVTQSGTGKPTEKTYADALGREVRSSITRFGGAELKTDKQYDSYGRLNKVSLPSTGEPGLWNTYQYDQYDRPVSIQAANGNTVTYAYNGNSITETKNGIASTKSFDVAGNVASVTDPGGTITYNLRADGQPASVTAPGGITTTFEYDVYGRRTKIVDPSTGTKTFGYDPWGNPNSETDANGKVTSLTYDAYGRVTNKTTPEISTAYTYNSDGLLQSEVSDNGTAKELGYDHLGRTTTYKETAIGGKWLQKSYTYASGLLQSVAYTSQSGAIATESNTYQNGYLKTIATGGQVIFDLQEENAAGQPTRVVSGGITRRYSFDAYGMPTGRSAQTGAAGTYMNFEYSFDPLTGNLAYRKDLNRNLTESFGYDNLNRLVSFGGQTMAYDDKGNITQKGGVGDFHYLNNAKPYALTGIVQSGTVIPQRQQAITYASFSRPLAITEDGYAAQFTYDAGGDRVRMQVQQGGALVLNRYYLGDQYEIDEKPTGTREKLYLGGDYYSAGAVLVRDNGGAWQLYYLNSDYLGSITHVVNSAGQVVAEYSYDAWGRMRNPATHQMYAVGEEPELFLGRGYTGHEHLPWFGLINMNARLYDPVHGRFLAPDPYVQAPDFTQNFNRFTYGLNNPLSYVDQNGEFMHLVIGALIGGVVNWAINGAEFSWRGLAYFGVGAVAGALSAGVGAGVSSAMAGGSFGAGFWGTSAAMTATSSFVSGAAIGGAAGFSGGFTSGVGNGLLGGQNFVQALGSGARNGIIGGVSGGLVGGIAGGIDAAIHGRRFFDGATVKTEVLVDQNIPLVGQVGNNNCLLASVEATDQSFGGSLRQNDVRGWFGGDPNTTPLGDVDVWSKYSNVSGHKLVGEFDKSTALPRILSTMQDGGRVALNLNTGEVGHSVIMKSVIQKTITKINGSVVTKYIYKAMNPGNGGFIMNVSSKEISKAYNIFYIFKR